MAADAETNTNAWQNSSASLEHLRRGGVTMSAAAGLDDAEEFNKDGGDDWGAEQRASAAVGPTGALSPGTPAVGWE